MGWQGAETRENSGWDGYERRERNGLEALVWTGREVREIVKKLQYCIIFCNGKGTNRRKPLRRGWEAGAKGMASGKFRPPCLPTPTAHLFTRDLVQLYIFPLEANDSSITYKIILSSIPQHIPECAWWSNPVEVMTSTQLLISDYSIINKSHHNISYNHN